MSRRVGLSRPRGSERVEHRRDVRRRWWPRRRRRETWSSSTRHRLMPVGLGRRDHLVGAAGHAGEHGVEERVVHQRVAQRARDRLGAARAPGARSRPARRRRDSWRTSRPSPRAAPARCRCCWWPCRGGCAARGSAAPAGTPARRRRPATHRPAGRAAAGRAWRAPRGSRRAVRRIPLAHRNVWVLPNATSAPISPGGVISVSASRSAPTATSAPRSCACVDQVGSSRRPRRWRRAAA